MQSVSTAPTPSTDKDSVVEVLNIDTHLESDDHGLVSVGGGRAGDERNETRDHWEVLSVSAVNGGTFCHPQTLIS